MLFRESTRHKLGGWTTQFTETIIRQQERFDKAEARLKNLEEIAALGTLEKGVEKAEKQRDRGEDKRDEPLPNFKSATLHILISF